MSQNTKALAAGAAARAHDNNSAALAHEDSTTTARESIHSEAARDWLNCFPIGSRFRVGLWFNITARDMHEELNPSALIQCVRLKLARHIREGRGPQYTDACLVLQALEDDPDGALAYAKAVIAHQQLPPAEQARLKAAKAVQYQRAHMAQHPPTDKQLLYLRCLGYTGPKPANRLEASERIAALLRRREGLL